MEDIKSYKDLLVWSKGIEIVKEAYNILSFFPKEEQYVLQDQIKRSAISIPSNIAEGWGRSSSKSFSHFLKISRGSLLELETQFFIARELNYISVEKYNKIENLITVESKMLNAFIKKIDMS